MRARLVEVCERRARLVECARSEREHLDALLDRAAAAISWTALLRATLDQARRRPLMLATIVAAGFGLRPKRILRLLASAWSLWQFYGRARRWWQRFAPPPGTAPRAT